MANNVKWWLSQSTQVQIKLKGDVSMANEETVVWMNEEYIVSKWDENCYLIETFYEGEWFDDIVTREELEQVYEIFLN